MNKEASRRIVPESVAALVVVGLLGLFELLVLFGALEVNGASVAAVAPWAYEPFCKLVGEHSAQLKQREDLALFTVDVEDDEQKPSDASGEGESVFQLAITNESFSTVFEDESEPQAWPAWADEIDWDENLSTNSVPDEPLEPEEIIPVG